MKQQFLVKSLVFTALILSASSCKAVEPEVPQQQTVTYTLCNANATAEVNRQTAVSIAAQPGIVLYFLIFLSLLWALFHPSPGRYAHGP